MARPCPPGTYSNDLNLQGADQCTICPMGSSCATGVTTPTPCAPGSITNSTGQSECQSCADGKYQSRPGQSNCDICGAGNYSANILSCEPCQVGEVCPLGATTGQRCPIDFTTLGPGAQSLGDCGCFPGFYEKNATDPECVQCPEGSACVNATTKLEALPLAPGYWRQKNVSEEMRACFTEAACLGGTNVSVQCAPGQRGPYCAVCDEGYIGGGDGALCVACGEGSLFRTVLPGIILGIVTLVLLGYLLVSCWRGKDVSAIVTRAAVKGANMEAVVSEAFEDGVKSAVTTVSKDEVNARAKARAEDVPESRFARIWNKLEGAGVKLKILIALFQMLNGIGLTFSIRFPQAYRDALNFFGSVFQLDLPKAMPLGCIMEMGFFSSLVTRTLLPLIVMLILAGSGKLLKQRYNKPELAAMCSNGWFYILFLIYPSCSSAVFQAFNCDYLEDGTPMLRVDYNIVCWEGSHVGMVSYAVIMMIIYPIGTPLLYAAMLYANHEELDRIRAMELRAAAAKALLARTPDTDDDEVAKARKHHQAVATEAWDSSARGRMALAPALQKLTGGYEMRCYWFEVFECIRKIALVGLPVFMPTGSAAQLICGLLVCFISFGMFVNFDPYIDEGDDKLASVCQTALFFSLVSSIALKMEYDTSSAALGVLLPFTLAVPPIIAFFYQSGVDFEKGLNASAVRARVQDSFEKTLGRCLTWCLQEKIELSDPSSGDEAKSSTSVAIAVVPKPPRASADNLVA